MLNRTCDQAEFANLVGITQPAVSDLQRRGVLRDGGTGQVWLKAYCEHLREQAAGRAGLLAEASAALKQEQRDEVAMRNELKRRQYAPVSLLAQVLARAGLHCARILDGLVPAIHQNWQDASVEQSKLIEGEVAKARNVWAAMSLDTMQEAKSNDDPGA